MDFISQDCEGRGEKTPPGTVAVNGGDESEAPCPDTKKI
ncbi:MAG: hypothetical protein A4E44_01200 [Methanosaeta sp. PtaB.Bin018]|jgi:hypothetical protein|nr:MAG: hypothetical protein A4E44_01200 [Methanosaeta sp. PtaB.Bin018]OPY46119.1 MAG: hypothetical protein A4E46_01010 [Methanosaeta sp. PtaU1.Bin016]